jgi:hypothetical protein
MSAAVVVFFSLASNALATSAVQEIRMYNKIEAEFTKNAQACDLKGIDGFKNQLKASLEKVGVRESKDSIVVINLEVGGIPFGGLQTQCAVDAQLVFVTLLRPENIKTDNPRVQKALGRLSSFPVILYEVGAFAVDTTLYTVYQNRNMTQAEKKVLEIIDRLVMRFDEARKKK